jgi:hypothetical protein
MVNVKDWTEIERLVRSTTDNGGEIDREEK